MIRKGGNRIKVLNYRSLIRFAIVIWLAAHAHPASALVMLPFRHSDPNMKAQIQRILKEHGLELCRALHPDQKARCRRPPSWRQVVEVWGLDHAWSSESILGILIDTDSLSRINGLSPVVLTPIQEPMAVRAAPGTVHTGEVILGRPVASITAISGSGDLTGDKVALIAALVGAVGVPADDYPPRPVARTESRGEHPKVTKGSGRADVYFGMPW